jgi:hypothetical protein
MKLRQASPGRRDGVEERAPNRLPSSSRAIHLTAALASMLTEVVLFFTGCSLPVEVP